jgi:hypothetical protein
MNGGNQMVWPNNSNGNNNFYPFIAVNFDNEAAVKLNEDQYKVYVNNNFIGHKTLKNAAEKLSDIDGFLRKQGLNDFSSSLNGNHYILHTNEQVSDITNALSVYFNNR